MYYSKITPKCFAIMDSGVVNVPRTSLNSLKSGETSLFANTYIILSGRRSFGSCRNVSWSECTVQKWWPYGPFRKLYGFFVWRRQTEILLKCCRRRGQAAIFGDNGLCLTWATTPRGLLVFLQVQIRARKFNVTSITYTFCLPPIASWQDPSLYYRHEKFTLEKLPLRFHFATVWGAWVRPKCFAVTGEAIKVGPWITRNTNFASAFFTAQLDSALMGVISNEPKRCSSSSRSIITRPKMKGRRWHSQTTRVYWDSSEKGREIKFPELYVQQSTTIAHSLFLRLFFVAPSPEMLTTQDHAHSHDHRFMFKCDGNFLFPPPFICGCWDIFQCDFAACFIVPQLCMQREIMQKKLWSRVDKNNLTQNNRAPFAQSAHSLKIDSDQPGID